MSMDKKLTAAVYAAVEKAYDHQCDIKDAADEILEIIEADRQRRGEPVGYIMPSALKQLKAGGHAVVGGVSQGFDVPIYTAPQPAEPDEWKLAVDHELTNIHSTADSYSSAKDAVKALIDWHVAVVTDPVFQQPAEPVKVPSDDDSLTIAYMSGYHDGKRSMTPEGWQLVPKELTRNMMYAGVAEWLTRDDPEEDVQGIWKAMLAAAPKFGEDL